MSAVDFSMREVQFLEHKQAINALNQQLAARKNQLSEVQFSLQQLPTVMAQKVQALRNDLAYVEQRIAQVTIRRASVIRAPTNGAFQPCRRRSSDADPQRPARSSPRSRRRRPLSRPRGHRPETRAGRANFYEAFLSTFRHVPRERR
jgi:hypothetical protein